MLSLFRFKSFSKVFFLLLVCAFLSLYGCQKQNQDFSDGTALVKSEQGVKMDALLPEDLKIFAKIGTQDEIQLKNVKTLMNYFPQGTSDNIHKVLIQILEQSFGQNLPESFKALKFEDFVSSFNEKSQIVLGLAPSTETQSQAEESSKPLSSGELQVPPVVVIAVSLKDEQSAEQIFDKLALLKSDGSTDSSAIVFKKETYDNHPYLVYTSQSPKNTLYVAQFKDVVFFSNNLEQFKKSLDNALSGKSVEWTSNQDFQKALASYKPNLGYVYMDMQYYFSALSALNVSQANDETVKKSMQTILSSSGFDVIKASSYLVTAENDGLRLELKTLGENLLSNSNSLYSILVKALDHSYLYKKLPIAEALMYMEAHSLKSFWDFESQLLSAFASNFTQSYEQFKKALDAQGFDLEKDLLAFMDKGFSFSFDDNGSLLPGVFVAMDASSHVDGAKKAMRKFHEIVDKAVKQMKADSPEIKDFFKQEEKISDNSSIWSVKFDLDKALKATAPMAFPDDITSQKIEFYYGLNSDQLAFLAFKPGFVDDYGKKFITDSEEFKKSLDYIKGNDVNLIYFSPSQMISYVDHLIATLKKLNPQIDQGMQEYEEFKSYINPFKSFIMASSMPTETELDSQVFVHIGQ